MSASTEEAHAAESKSSGPRKAGLTGSGPRKESPAEEVCPICGGKGFVVADVPVGHPDFGRALPCICKKRERLERKLQSLAGVSGHTAVQHLTFESFETKPVGKENEIVENLEASLRVARSFATDPDGWLLITGAYGSGKTHLAAAIVNARLAQGEPALFVVVADLLDHLRSAFAPDSEVSYDGIFDPLRDAPLLVLDDLGAHSATSWAQEKLFQLINYRYNLRLPTVITTNQRMDELDSRVASRIQDLTLVKRIIILAPDYRTGGSSAREELSTLRLYGDRQFDSFVVNRIDLKPEQHAKLKATVEACRRFARDLNGWLVLQGPAGCGKSHLAAAMANSAQHDAGVQVMFVSVASLLDHLRAAYNPQSMVSLDRRFDDVKRVRLLVLDNMGTENATTWAREKLVQLLEYRYDANLPTVITTTREPKNLDSWFAGRVEDDTRVSFIRMDTPSWKGSQSRPATQSTRAPRR